MSKTGWNRLNEGIDLKKPGFAPLRRYIELVRKAPPKTKVVGKWGRQRVPNPAYYHYINRLKKRPDYERHIKPLLEKEEKK